MSQALMPFGGEPGYVAGYLRGYQTQFITQANGYTFKSEAPQSELDAAIVQANARVPAPPPAEETNTATIENNLRQAMATIDNYLALSNPSAAQRLQYERLIGRCVKNLIRFRLSLLDAAD